MKKPIVHSKSFPCPKSEEEGAIFSESDVRDVTCSMCMQILEMELLFCKKETKRVSKDLNKFWTTELKNSLWRAVSDLAVLAMGYCFCETIGGNVSYIAGIIISMFIYQTCRSVEFETYKI